MSYGKQFDKAMLDLVKTGQVIAAQTENGEVLFYTDEAKKDVKGRVLTVAEVAAHIAANKPAARNQPRYTAWLILEEYDEANDTYRILDEDNVGMPAINMRESDSMKELVEWMLKQDPAHSYGRREQKEILDVIAEHTTTYTTYVDIWEATNADEMESALTEEELSEQPPLAYYADLEELRDMFCALNATFPTYNPEALGRFTIHLHTESYCRLTDTADGADEGDYGNYLTLEDAKAALEEMYAQFSHDYTATQGAG